MNKYRLVGKIAVPETDIHKWARSMGIQDRRVAKDVVGGVLISTVFLGMDHAWGDGPPLVFETMVFEEDKPGLEIEMLRYSTWDEAEKGHAMLVKKYEAMARAAVWNG